MAADLAKLRAQIEEVDNGIIRLLAKRSQFVKEIGKVKASMDLPIANQELENKKLEKYTQTADTLGVSGELVQNVFEEIFFNARHLQEEE